VRNNSLFCILVAILLSGCAQPQAQVKSEPNDFGAIERQAKANPNNGVLQLNLATEYMRRGRYEEAAEAYKSIHLNNSVLETWSWHNAALAYDKAGKKEAAIAAIKRAIELNPGHADNFVYLAKFQFELGNYDDSVTAARQAASIQPTLWVAHNYIGASLGKKKQYAEAISSLMRASELAPREAANFNLLGEFHLEQGQYSEAAAAYFKSSELAPDDTRGPAGVAAAHYFAGRYDEAIPFATRASDLSSITGIGANVRGGDTFPIVDSVFENGPAAKAGLKKGDVFTVANGQSARNWGFDLPKFFQVLRGPVGTAVSLTIERGGSSLEKTIVRETIDLPAKSNFLATRSLCYLGKGDVARALEDANAAFAVNPKDTSSFFALTSVHLKNGDFEKALQTSKPLTWSRGQLLRATALARLSKTDKAIETFAAISRADLPDYNVPCAAELKAFFDAMKPYVSETRNRAAALESKGQQREALAAYSDALKAADRDDSRAILSACFALVRKNPVLGQAPEEARKYAIRSEVRVKEGNFSEAFVEIRKAINEAPYIGQFYFNAALIQSEMKHYRDAIDSMNVFLSAAPDSPHARAAKDEIIKWEMKTEKGK
jgi:tetratricopeptide (TPR) repeat protein